MTSSYGTNEYLFGEFIWPCSHILSKFIEDNKELFINKTVLEIGSGIHALCGKKADEIGSIVTITDGHPDIISRINAPGCKICKLEYGEVIDKFDIIIGADIYYGGFNIDLLLNTIHNSLNPEGKCYLALEDRLPTKLNGKIIKEISPNEIDLNIYTEHVRPYINCKKYIICITN